jgi:acyl-CoA hydrolase
MEGPGPQPAGDEWAAKNVTPIAPFVGGNLRNQIAAGDAEAIPIHLGELPLLFKRKILEPDVAFVHVSPPDKHGYCTLGTSVDWMCSGIEHTKKIVALINPQVPRVFGDGLIHYTQFDTVFHHDAPLHYGQGRGGLTEEEVQIGRNVAALIPDGATLQMGIGSVSDAVLAQLGSHKNLGIHTEMFSDGVLPLVENGAINNSLKSDYRGRIVSSFAIGSQKLYDFINNNPCVNFLDVDYTNSVAVIREQSQMHAINSCFEMDLTGQAASSDIGKMTFSGFGGQVEFLRGAQCCPDGKAFLAFPSRTPKGHSKIVPQLKDAAGVVATRAVVNYVVTEYGAVNLMGLTMPQRARELISIAHPLDRVALDRAAFERWGSSFTTMSSKNCLRFRQAKEMKVEDEDEDYSPVVVPPPVGFMDEEDYRPYDGPWSTGAPAFLSSTAAAAGPARGRSFLA